MSPLVFTAGSPSTGDSFHSDCTCLRGILRTPEQVRRTNSARNGAQVCVHKSF